MISKLFPTLGLLAALVSQAGATITIQLQADLLQNSSGTAVSQSSLFVLVADTSGNGFAQVGPGASTATGNSTTLGGDDYVVFRGAVGAGSSTNGVLFSTANNLDSTIVPGDIWNMGDRLALLWFPDLTSSSLVFNFGTPYGLYSRLDPVNSSAIWVTPSFNPSSNITLAFYTANGSTLVSPGQGANPADAGRANLVVGVPEPTSALLVVGGMGVLAASRRRR